MINLLFAFSTLLAMSSCNSDKKIQQTIKDKLTPYQSCLSSVSECSNVDIDSPDALKAFTFGCNESDYYSCSRLGQYYQLKEKKKVDKAIQYYKKSCDGKDKYGCEGLYDLAMKMCFIENQSKYCNIVKPKGEFRIWYFLKSLDEKHIDCFIDHNFSYGLTEDKAEKLFIKRRKEKNPIFLKALKMAIGGKYYDGDGAETLNAHIRVMNGGNFHLEGS